MNVYTYMVFLAVSFLASIAGAICGIGGGVLIKPILDACGVLDVSTISFLSGCTVLAMSCYCVLFPDKRGETQMDLSVSRPLAVGAAVGGAAGKVIFQVLAELSANQNRVGALQAACLLAVTLGTLAYTLMKRKIKTRRVKSRYACLAIGLGLGMCSSFLGIGGGPINLVVLYFFFSMETKEAAGNSLYIILFSQAAALLQSIITGTVPEAGAELVVLMAAGGLLGGAAGRRFNKKLDACAVEHLFSGLMCAIMLICVYNMVRFS